MKIKLQKTTVNLGWFYYATTPKRYVELPDLTLCLDFINYKYGGANNENIYYS